MQSSPSSWPGKGLERILFFLVFKHPWEAQQKPLGLDAHRRGQDVPCGPRSCARADTTCLRGARAGHELPTAPCSPSPRLCVRAASPGLHSPSGVRRDPRALGAKEGERPSKESGVAAPSVRAPIGHRLQPAGTATQRGTVRSNHCREKLGPRAR